MTVCLNESTKKENVIAVFEAVADHGCCTRAEIAAATGLSTVTVGKAAESLLDAGIFLSRSNAPKGVGRKAEQLCLDQRGVLVVFNLGSFCFSACFFSLSGELLDTYVFHEIPDFCFRDNLKYFLGRAKNYMVEHGKDKVYLANCLVVPGSYDAESDTVVSTNGGFVDLKVRDYISRVASIDIDMVIDSSDASLRWCITESEPGENVLVVTADGEITARIGLAGVEIPRGANTFELIDSEMQYQVSELVAFMISTMKIDRVFIQTESCRWINSRQINLLVEDVLTRNGMTPKILVTNDDSYAPRGAMLILRKHYLHSLMQ